MVGSGQAGGRGVARLLLVCAVLAGLFLMHGAPATAAGGCQGGASAPMSLGGAHAMAAGGHRAMARPGSESAARATAQAGDPSMAHGAMCVSTPARERSLLPLNACLSVVAVLVFALLAGRAVVRGRAELRGPPPPGGRGLLLHVSVART